MIHGLEKKPDQLFTTMHPTVRLALEYAILKSAMEVACVLDENASSPDLSADGLKQAIGYEMVSGSGTCSFLAPVDSLLSKLEARDLEDDGVHEELLRLAPSEHVTDVVRACAFFAAVQSMSSEVKVEDVVFGAVDISSVPTTKEELDAMMSCALQTEEAGPSNGEMDETDEVDGDSLRELSDLKSGGNLPVLPLRDDLDACTSPTEVQRIAKELMSRF